MMTSESVNLQTEKKSVILNGLESAFTNHDDQYAVLRSTAMDTLQRLPVPTSRTEAWRYTRTGKVLNQSWKASSGLVETTVPSLSVDGIRLVFVDGVFRTDLSDQIAIAGLSIRRLGDRKENLIGTLSNHASDWFEALNAAFFTDGVCIEVEEKTQISTPIHLVYLTVSADTASFSRNSVVVNTSASLTMFCHFVGNHNAAFSSVVTEAFLGPNASLKIDKIQEGNQAAFHHVEWVKQARDSKFDISTITLQSNWVRNDLNIRVAGENCYSGLSGAYMIGNKDQVDNHTMVDHLVPNCNSNELYKGIVRQSGTGIFNGKVFVRPDAQKTNAFQQNANIVLDDTATMFSKPELEIYADDVKCSHGSTTGQFDEEAVFYLRARGIGEMNARKLLVEAFLADAINSLSDERLKLYCTEKFQLMLL